MRSLVVAIGLLAFVSTADAKPRRATKTVATKSDKQSKSKRSKKQTQRAAKKKRISASSRKQRLVIKGPIEGQSVGACWLGRLRDATKLASGDGWFIRRPYRAYGTQSTVDFVERILTDVIERFPDIHTIAIGDLSAEHGGPISEHSSHQSGRDIDVGLIFMDRPSGYPQSFVIGDADNLDLEATFVLVEEFAKTSQSGGAQMIFLDLDLQGLLYHWALENGENEDYLAWLFQYPHGKGASAGLVRHEPHHADHLHVRFRCPAGDSACR
ncbi:MAG TPA: penicillin-insensitive murein endopeptidase [Kofleriaceae bacterium]